MFHSYKWLGEKGTEQSNTIFTPTLTSGGLCFSFNMLDHNELFTEG